MWVRIHSVHESGDEFIDKYPCIRHMNYKIRFEDNGYGQTVREVYVFIDSLATLLDILNGVYHDGDKYNDSKDEIILHHEFDGSYSIEIYEDYRE